MEKKTKIILGIGVVLILAIIGFIKFTGNANILGFEIKIPSITESEINPPKLILIEKGLEVIDITNKKEMYKIGERANLTFTIKNTINSSYNLTVDWIFDGSRIEGWKNISTFYYNTSNVFNHWYSWSPPLLSSGNYKAQILIESNSKEYPITAEKILIFEVA